MNLVDGIHLILIVGQPFHFLGIILDVYQFQLPDKHVMAWIFISYQS